MTLGENIARLRAERRLSQGDLADALGVSRQSVSKWETDASVPELDKLVRLNELFGVTLDRLVKGEAADKDEEPKQEVPPPVKAEETHNVSLARTVAGGVLLAVGALGLVLLLLFAGLEGLLLGLFFMLPLVLWGIICLRARSRVGLWCAWAIVLPQQVYWTYATGLTWGVVRWTAQWTPEMNYVRLAVAWVMLVVRLALLVSTLWSFRRVRLTLKPTTVALAVLLLAAAVLWGCVHLPDLHGMESLLRGLGEGVNLAAFTGGAGLLMALYRGRSAN